MTESQPPDMPSSSKAEVGTTSGNATTPDNSNDSDLTAQELSKEEKSPFGSVTSSRNPSLADDRTSEIVYFSRNDPENPHNWSTSKKAWVVIAGIVAVLNSTLGSSLPSGATQETAAYFNITNQAQLVLPNSIYLVGYVLGPLVFAPLSESYGRKIVMIATFALFTVFTMACALAPNFAALIVFRLLVGIGASSPVSVVGGIFADVYDQATPRGLAVALFMTATTWGPLCGPIISGFVAPVSWRWPYWVALIVAGASWPFLLLIPETYAPVILVRKARKMRLKTGNPNIKAPMELVTLDFNALMTDVLTRPIRMFLFEAIVLTTCLYLALCYAIFYIFFQAYPIIFQGIYGFNAGEEGLAFLPIGVGAVLACCFYVYWASFLKRSKAKNPPPAWTLIEEYNRLPLACFGGPLFVISLFWLGWTSRADVHWIVPTLSALPFGVGFLLIFMGELNYLVDAYEVYAASAMGAASCTRSAMGVVLPFAARPMYENLGVGWACSLLGFLSLALAIVPFGLIKYGDRIRANSTFCQELRLRKQREDEEQAARLAAETTDDLDDQHKDEPEKMV